VQFSDWGHHICSPGTSNANVIAHRSHPVCPILGGIATQQFQHYLISDEAWNNHDAHLWRHICDVEYILRAPWASSIHTRIFQRRRYNPSGWRSRTSVKTVISVGVDRFLPINPSVLMIHNSTSATTRRRDEACRGRSIQRGGVVLWSRWAVFDLPAVINSRPRIVMTNVVYMRGRCLE